MAVGHLAKDGRNCFAPKDRKPEWRSPAKAAPFIFAVEVEDHTEGSTMSEKPSVTLPGTVDRIMESGDPSEAAKAHITIEKGAAPLYREIRIENTLTKEDGKKVELKTGATVEVTVRANSSRNSPKALKNAEYVSGCIRHAP
jgi:hypothetical protein